MKTFLNGTGKVKLQETVANDTKTTSTVCAAALIHVKALTVLLPLFYTLSANANSVKKIK